MPRELIYRSVLQQTLNAFHDAVIAEIDRLARIEAAKRAEIARLAIRPVGAQVSTAGENKRMKRVEAAKHRTLVRWLLAHRLRDRGYTLEAIGGELGGVTRQRVEQILSSPEPVRWNREMNPDEEK